ncbi:hypothetical protein [Pseudofrankia asymbiotica]|uniref:Uncharacterized protein n=1 Tax=Pseudofrankia asymbiotica TaxID=1834516 RepID=A0A1V2I362_9ACTN|nr:hypothetical protein [Pseudofrankia asymbiotica]ONH24743.1 hypothetical protein BL253_29400 [Pseudofrankia asymbiotica]
MAVTPWDGHVRVDYVPDLSSLQVTLATVWPMKVAVLRRGLRAGFARDDPDGPPAFVEVRAEGGQVPADVRDLLGDRLLAEIQQVVAGPSRSRWLRINLRAVDELAEAWAPYRRWILADESPAPAAAAAEPTPVLGRLARGLWSWLGVGDLRDALSLPPTRDFGFRSAGSLDDDDDDDEDIADEPSPPTASGRWALPVELAWRTGVERDLAWEVYSDRRIHLIARRAVTASSDPPPLEVAFDDGTERWTRFVSAEPGVLRTSIVSAADPSRLPPIKVRTRNLP